MDKQILLRSIPKVDELLRADAFDDCGIPPLALRDAARAVLDAIRADIIAGKTDELPYADEICDAILKKAKADTLPSLRPVVNATGVVLHTNLGRACLSEKAAKAAYDVARGYSTLEYDVERGCRGSRHDHVEELLCRTTGAQAAMVVNNNAAAVLLILSALGRGGEVITSRGEEVEIGGSFRIPEIMTQCGCTLREVGTTNKTHLSDYENAINENTRALLKVHTSNFRIVGFSESVSLDDMVALGEKYSLPVIQDLGSGSLFNLEAFGIHDEPTVQISVDAGVDVISFSGDKLLGGPQAGIIIGKKNYIDMLKKHPLARAIRVDKMTLAALRATLEAYLDERTAASEIPTLSMLAQEPSELRAKASELRDMLKAKGIICSVIPCEDQVGGGSVPTQLLPSYAVAIEAPELSPDALEEAMRVREIPIIARISHDNYLLDVRTIARGEFDIIADALSEVLA